MPDVSPPQIRAARALLGWSMLDLSSAAQVSVSTVKRVENGGMSAVSPATVDMIRMTLEAKGIRFLPDEGAGIGLRLHAPSSP